ncbi:uncharacterized protein LOC123542883 [Mercenaria mercenaria]|uniref:uncharacterized protein LOC123542883 n=1 Tax=Mercenaria mercenaria TaxID=6596 RepID=UPI00234F5001|nr:uncharacterized protein LOC123542883 [Mercenaria mercenaria]
MPRVLAIIYLFSIGQCLTEAYRCFECSNIPHLRDCSIVTQCNTHEICYVQEIVTTSGHILFNSGCRTKENCKKLTGRSIGASYNGNSNITVKDTATRTMVRRNDISVCEQCCDSEFCNNHGCNEIATPVNQRGPYCFSCKRQRELDTCRHVTQCSPTQVCLVKKLLDSGTVVYDSHCIEQVQCDVIKQTYQHIFGKRSQNANYTLPHVTSKTNQDHEDSVTRLERANVLVSLCILCCDTDFCNDSCITNARRI